jgi:prepilin-type N-terminal cleavage/methylation domain-containing protein
MHTFSVRDCLSAKNLILRRTESGEAGFTLVELIIASAISALVLGILAMCLTFALRAWESQQNRRQGSTPPFVDLIRAQLTELDPTPMVSAEGSQLIFKGFSSEMSFVTSHSVKAISKGVPVIARYIYESGEKKLYYGEMPMNPYDLKYVQDFLDADPLKGEKPKARFYAIDVEDFALSYGSAEKDSYVPNWESETEVPAVILIRWKDDRAVAYGQVVAVNSPLPVQPRRVLPGAQGVGGLGPGTQAPAGLDQ